MMKPRIRRLRADHNLWYCYSPDEAVNASSIMGLAGCGRTPEIAYKYYLRSLRNFVGLGV